MLYRNPTLSQVKNLDKSWDKDIKRHEKAWRFILVPYIEDLYIGKATEWTHCFQVNGMAQSVGIDSCIPDYGLFWFENEEIYIWWHSKKSIFAMSSKRMKSFFKNETRVNLQIGTSAYKTWHP